MIQKNINIIRLYPSINSWLTQKELDDENNRMFSKSVFCNYDVTDAWIEVDEEYKTKWELEHSSDLDIKDIIQNSNDENINMYNSEE